MRCNGKKDPTCGSALPMHVEKYLLISQLIKGSKEKFFLLNQIFDENIRRLLQGKSFSSKNAIKLLLAAFYQLTYQHDSKDFNICNYKRKIFGLGQNKYLIMVGKLL